MTVDAAIADMLRSSEYLAEVAPELLACLFEQRPCPPRCQLEPVRVPEVFFESCVNRAAKSRLQTATFSSSFSSSDRLSKFADPNMLITPSATSTFVCIMVGWYSAICTPSESRRS